MTVEATRLAEGMEVVGPEGEDIGEVKEVRDGEFVVGRTLQPAATLPFDVIAAVIGHQVHLSIDAEEVDERFWVHAGEDIQIETRNVYD